LLKLISTTTGEVNPACIFIDNGYIIELSLPPVGKDFGSRELLEGFICPAMVAMEVSISDNIKLYANLAPPS